MKYHDHADRIRQPEDDLKIFRYLDGHKFKDLVQSSTIYFRRVDKFGKYVEGYFSLEDQAYFRQKKVDITIYERFPKEAYINCWTKAGGDNRNFWIGYTNEKMETPREGVCIESTVAKIRKQLEDNSVDSIFNIALVDYFDPISGRMEIINIVRLLSRKINDYRREEEVRFMINMFFKEPESEFIKIEVDIKKVIDRIIISPFAHESYLKDVREMIAEKDFDVKIDRSRIPLDSLLGGRH